jgi:hypothetical protein
MRDNSAIFDAAEVTKEDPKVAVIPKEVLQRNKRIYTFLADLPSEGKMYPEGHPLRDKTKIELKQMTAKEENILASVDFVEAGIEIQKLLESVVLIPELDVNTIVSIDRQSLIYNLRVNAFGKGYGNSDIKCPECGSKLKKMQIPDFVKPAVELPEGVNISSAPDGAFYVISPSKRKIKLKPLTLPEERAIFKKSMVNGKFTSLVLPFLETAITEIDGESDTDELKEIIENLRSLDTRFLMEIYTKIFPPVKLSVKAECTSCEMAEEVEVPLDAAFFWNID